MDSKLNQSNENKADKPKSKFSLFNMFKPKSQRVNEPKKRKIKRNKVKSDTDNSLVLSSKKSDNTDKLIDNIEEIEETKTKQKEAKKPKKQKHKNKSKTKTKTKKPKVTIWDMYKDLIIQKISLGDSIRKGNLSGGHMQIEYDRIYTNKYVSKVWCVLDFSSYTDFSILGTVRAKINREMPNCKTKIQMNTRRYMVNLENKDTQLSINNWYKKARKANIDVSKMDEVQKAIEWGGIHKGREYTKRVIQSIVKIGSYKKKGRALFQAYVFIIAYCPNNDELRTYETKLSNILSEFNITAIPVKNMNDFMKKFCIVSKKSSKLCEKELSEVILADTDFSCITPLTQGVTGTVGIYGGTCIRNGLPLFFNPTVDEKGQVGLIVGKIGEGKSFYFKHLAHFEKLLKHRMVIMDYNGKEYIEHCRLHKGVTISQRIENSCFVNTLKITNITGLSQKEALQLYYESAKATERVFQIIYGQDVYELDDASSLFSDILNELYIKSGVDRNNPLTYPNSNKLTYDQIYYKILDFERQPAMVKKHGDTLVKAKKRCEPYFAPDGVKHYMFETEISLDDIKHSDYLRFDFGMNTDADSLDKDFLIRMNNMIHLTKLYTTYNKYVLNIFTMVGIEEAQRALLEPMFARLINHLVTGGRQLNLIVWILCNSVAWLLNGNTDTTAIADNITTQIVGSTSPRTREQLITMFELDMFKDTLNQISNNDKYLNTFLVNFVRGRHSKVEIAKMDIPNKYSSVFSTRKVETF